MSKKKCQATKGREGEKEEVQNGEGQKEESLSNEEMRMRWAKRNALKREKSTGASLWRKRVKQTTFDEIGRQNQWS